jgi:hypothetical protein
MIKKIVFAALTVATLAVGSAHAGSLMPVYGMSNDVLINRPDIANSFTTICYGCISDITGLPRTEYVRPHYNSGRYVDGYFRSRR